MKTITIATANNESELWNGSTPSNPETTYKTYELNDDNQQRIFNFFYERKIKPYWKIPYEGMMNNHEPNSYFLMESKLTRWIKGIDEEMEDCRNRIKTLEYVKNTLTLFLNGEEIKND